MDFCFLDHDQTPSKEQVGGKGFYLHEMTRMGLPVPPAALLTTELWQRYRKAPKKVAKELREQILPQVVEYLKQGNGGVMPLVSVRSSGAVSMPGMMDTVLNVGLTEEFINAARAPAKASKTKQKSAAEPDASFAADLYARFLTMYGATVLGMDKKTFDAHKTYASVEEVETHFSELYAAQNQSLPPKSPEDQLLSCVLAVFDSWDNERAKLYRKLHKIDDAAGTAVVIQRMVFGNRNDASATGVVFSRNPSNGDQAMVGEYLINAQGEDVVSGSHTPHTIDTLAEDFPEAFAQIERVAQTLERHYKEVQDIEFTIENETLYLLQARTAKCSPFARLRMLMDLYQRDAAQPKEVLESLTLAEYLDLNIRQVDPSFRQAPDGTGLPASMGTVSGRVVFGPSSKYQGDPTIFVAQETTPDDLQAIHMATGILTATGGATSHAAVVARGMGKICVVGCSALTLEIKNGVEQARLGSHTLQSGDWITVDANEGRVWVGKDVPVVDAKNTKVFWDLEDMVFEANPQWTRVTSKVDELVGGKQTIFLTYALDDAEDAHLRNELDDACQYLTGVMDLTGKIDYLQAKYPNQFAMAQVNAEQVFLRKKAMLLKVADAAPYGHKFDFQVYLGPYEQEHGSDLALAGFDVRPQGSISFDASKDASAPLVVVQDDTRVPDERLAISSRNALLRSLK